MTQPQDKRKLKNKEVGDIVYINNSNEPSCNRDKRILFIITFTAYKINPKTSKQLLLYSAVLMVQIN